MGYAGVGDVRQGKYFELDVDAASAEAAQAVASEVAAQAAREPGHRELSRRSRVSPAPPAVTAQRVPDMKFAIVVFPGSNCDHDAYHAAKHVLGHEAEFVWHKETEPAGADVVVLPGGFSYGDYLRTGAIARFSPVMQAVGGSPRGGGPVLGICNGFQILLEAGCCPARCCATAA